jgi:hypothetical protein
MVVLLIMGTAGCVTPIKDNPIDEMANWTRAEMTFTLAVESVTLAGKAGEITKTWARRIEPLVDEGYDLLKKVRKTIDATPLDQDPVIEVDAINRLMRIGVKIAAALALEKEKK